MNKILYIGDPHVLVNELEDCEKLLQYVENKCLELQIDKVVILGDLFHNHSLVHVEVIKFWYDWFTKLTSKGIKIIAIPGNHDMPGISDSQANALLPFKNIIDVFDSPTVKYNILFMPFTLDRNEFVKTVNSFDCKTLVCHQTFNGVRYGGFDVPDGVIPESINKEVIAGHIHTGQSFGNIWYPGSPRWRTLQDANVEKYIWIVDHNEDGTIANKIKLSTKDICKSIRYLEDLQDNPLEDVMVGINEETRIDIKGTKEWVEKRKKLYDPTIKLRIFYTDRKNAEVKESEGVMVAFKKYLDMYKVTTGIDKQELYKLAKAWEL